MKYRCFAALALAMLLPGCAAAPDLTPVWQRDLPASGVHIELANAALLSDADVYYAATREELYAHNVSVLPAVKADGDQYSYTWFEQAWIPAGAEHLDAAKQFVAYLYSDEACKLFAESGAIQPVLGIADSLEGDNKMFYSIYDNGAKAAMGNFAAFSAIPGVEVRTVFFDPVNSLVSGSMTEQQWIDGIKSASDQMRANIIE